MVMAGALLHFGFFREVAGFFGQPAATDVAFAVACAFLSAAEPPAPAETVKLVNLALCCEAAFASTCWSAALSGTWLPVVVLVVELEGTSAEMPVSSNAAPCRQAMM
jgi:CHASE2 domain-containing sensor protein